METDLRNANMALETECNEKGKQLESTRQLFAKTRDQLRLDQASLESLRAVNRRLVDELKAAQDEVESAQGALKEAQSRASMSMSSMRGAVEDTTAKSNEQVNRLRLDLHDPHDPQPRAQLLSVGPKILAALKPSQPGDFLGQIGNSWQFPCNSLLYGAGRATAYVVADPRELDEGDAEAMAQEYAVAQAKAAQPASPHHRIPGWATRLPPTPGCRDSICKRIGLWPCPAAQRFSG